MKNTNSTLVRFTKGAALAAILAGFTGCVMDDNEPRPGGAGYAKFTPNAPDLTTVGQGAQGFDLIYLRPNDPLDIRIGGIPPEDAGGISGPYIIDSDGYINLPNVGRVLAAGKTQSQLQQAIQAAYKSGGFYTNPVVTVNATASRFIYINGAVRNPHRMVFTPDLTVLAAVSTAGGFTDYANKSRVRLLRDTHIYVLDVRRISTNPSLDIYLRPGDKLDIPQSFW